MKFPNILARFSPLLLVVIIAGGAMFSPLLAHAGQRIRTMSSDELTQALQALGPQLKAIEAQLASAKGIEASGLTTGDPSEGNVPTPCQPGDRFNSVTGDPCPSAPTTVGYSLTTSVSPANAGSITRDFDMVKYPTGTRVHLTPISNVGYRFAGWWSGDCMGLVATCDLTIGSRDMRATANFTVVNPRTYALNITHIGNGWGMTTVTTNIPRWNEDWANLPPRTVVTITADPSRTLSPSVRSYFAGWSGACRGSSPTCTLIMDGHKDVTANFTQPSGLPAGRVLNIIPAGTGAGTVTSNLADIYCGGDCSQLYNFVTNVRLTAAASPGSTFAGWSGGGCSSTGTCTVTMDTNKTVIATFTMAGSSSRDLTISVPASLTVSPTSVQASRTVTLPAWTVKNQGTIASGVFSNGFYLSSDSVITAGDTLLSSNNNLSLAAASTYRWGAPTLTIPAGTPAGTYYVGILVDKGNVVTESNEANNYKSVALAVIGTVAPPGPRTISGSLGVTGASVFSSVGTCSVSSSSYTCSGIPNGSNVIITPSKSGGNFSPTTRQHTNVTANLTGQNFTFTASAATTGAVRIRVKDAIAMAYLSNANVAFIVDGQVIANTVTDGNGLTSAVNVVIGKSLYLNVSHTGYTPRTNLSSGVVNSDTVRDALLTPTAATTRTISGSLGVTGASVFSSVGTCSVSSSSYTCSGIPNGSNVIITPSKSGGNFSPTTRQHTNVTANLTGQNFTFTASAATTRTLTITKNGTGTGTVNGSGISCGADCTQTYNINTQVTLSAVVGANSLFAGWTGACAGTANCIVTMDVAKTVNATFNTVEATNYTLNLTTNLVGAGTISRNPSQVNYTPGTVVTVTASPNSGYSFSNWSNGCSGTSPTCTVTMNGDRTVTANFTAATRSISGSLGVTGASVFSSVGTCSVSSSSYTCSGIPNGSNVIITPSKSGGNFSPTTRQHTNVTANLTGQNFTFTASAATAPDLIVSAPATLTVSPTSVRRGNSITLPAHTIRNQGTAVVSGLAHIGFYLSSNSAITASDILLNGYSLSDLASGSNFDKTATNSVIPTGTAPGTYYVGILADDRNVVTESNEGNNYKVTTSANRLTVTN